MRLLHSVFCCVFWVAICILYDEGFLSLGLAFQWDVHRTRRWNHGLSYDKCQAQTSTYTSRNHSFFSVIKFLGLKTKLFAIKYFLSKSRKLDASEWNVLWYFLAEEGRMKKFFCIFFHFCKSGTDCLSTLPHKPPNNLSKQDKVTSFSLYWFGRIISNRLEVRFLVILPVPYPSAIITRLSSFINLSCIVCYLWMPF